MITDSQKRRARRSEPGANCAGLFRRASYTDAGESPRNTDAKDAGANAGTESARAITEGRATEGSINASEGKSNKSTCKAGANDEERYLFKHQETEHSNHCRTN